MVAKTSISYETQPYLHDTGYARVNLISFEDNIYSQVNTSDGSASLIINDDNEILLIHSVRPVVGEISWEIPRGGIDPGETPAEAASRELFEETGLTVPPKNLFSLGFINPDNGILNTKLYLFLHKTSQLRSSMSYIPDGVEVKGIKWVGKATVIEAIRTNEITESATVAALGKARLLGII
jgi:8-oxo-dGTP pyrophosphatase MutT (NUDIX family)